MKGLFLGAGASYECGMQLVWELTAEIRRWLPTEKLIHFQKIQNSNGGGWDPKVLSKVIELLENPSIHYESIIGALEIEYARENNNTVKQDFYGAIAFFLQSIYGLLLERQVKNFRYAMYSLRDYKYLRELADENRPLWVFSLNHDCVIELASIKYNIPIRSGFNHDISIGMKNTDGDISDIAFERLTRSEIQNKRFHFFDKGEFGINLIKLHGSLDIFGQNDEINYLKLKTPQESPQEYISKLAKINDINLQTCKKIATSCTNESIYNDEQDCIQFLRKSILSGVHKFSSVHNQIAPPEFLDLFKEKLLSVDSLICIGYSFGDKHIDEIFQNWLSPSAKKCLTIVNPGIKSCPAHFSHYTKQIKCEPCRTSDYFIRNQSGGEKYIRMLIRYLRKKRRDKIAKS